ncbi:CII family transcriptional regulator [Herbaspirillum sp. WKF16]|uniref:CII family transcriptional regulator n=1 Tax=Herbaspirillum sp. WKF16 TaxID=3028312 RepID=UPI0023AA0CE5|nr:CII family transcriptional regulator [Herbaspirillum sp. WKF16]WDZ97956.1 CII family transcriptional regulator [Herbaspirillum sp. WKF16]
MTTAAEKASPDPVEMTRKGGARILAEVLQRLAYVGQENAAHCMGVDPSTVSRAKQSLEQSCQLLAAIGLQVAASDSVVISQKELSGLKYLAARYLEADMQREIRA